MADNVVRVVKNNNFTIMSNIHLKDNRLSLKAKGLLSLVLSLPADWNYTIKGLQSYATDGRDSFRSSLSELEKYGYLYRSSNKRRDAKTGQLKNYEYTFFENPEENKYYKSQSEFTKNSKEKPISENPTQAKKVQKNPESDFPTLAKKSPKSPESDFPTLGNPTLGKPTLENPTLLSTDILSTDKLNTNITNNLSYQSKDNIDSKTQNENKMIDEIDFKTKLEKVKQQVKYDNLISKYSNAQIDEIIELIAWCLCTSLQSLKINGTSTDIMLMRTKIAQLTDKHIEYILECLHDNNAKIKNRRNYLLTCIYNATSSFKASKQKDTSYDLNEWEKYAMSLGT